MTEIKTKKPRNRPIKPDALVHKARPVTFFLLQSVEGQIQNRIKGWGEKSKVINELILAGLAATEQK